MYSRIISVSCTVLVPLLWVLTSGLRLPGSCSKTKNSSEQSLPASLRVYFSVPFSKRPSYIFFAINKQNLKRWEIFMSTNTNPNNFTIDFFLLQYLNPSDTVLTSQIEIRYDDERNIELHSTIQSEKGGIVNKLNCYPPIVEHVQFWYHKNVLVIWSCVNLMDGSCDVAFFVVNIFIYENLHDNPVHLDDLFELFKDRKTLLPNSFLSVLISTLETLQEDLEDNVEITYTCSNNIILIVGCLLTLATLSLFWLPIILKD